MAVMDSTDLKIGAVFVDGGQVFVVLKYEFIKKGRGQATIRVKVRNIETNSITEKTYSNEQKVEQADVVKRTAQFLYTDNDGAYFMDSLDYSQFSFKKSDLEWELNFLQDGMSAVTMFLDGNPVSIEIPKSVQLKIVDTSSAVAGNTAGVAMKEATLETGYKVQVPLFVNIGEVIKVNTDSGEYVARIN